MWQILILSEVPNLVFTILAEVFIYSYQDFEMFPCSAMNRAAIEFEKKTQASNLEQGQAMERNLISMAREIEKLRAELANAEKRARASAAAAVAATPGNSATDLVVLCACFCFP